MMSYIENFNIEPFSADSDHRTLAFSECTMFPIFKSGDKYYGNNYREISFLLSICYLFSSLLITS